MPFIRPATNYIPDINFGRPLSDAQVYLLTSVATVPQNSSDINVAELLTVTYANDAGNTVEAPQPLRTTKGGCLFTGCKQVIKNFQVNASVYKFAVYDRNGNLEYQGKTNASDFVDVNELAAPDSAVLVGGERADFIALNARRFASQYVVNVKDFGASPSATAAANDAAFAAARDSIPFGTILVPFGTYKLSQKFSLNVSGYVLKGEGTDLTVLAFYGDNGLKTGVEVNNGSWNDQTNTYTTGGVSIGSTRIQDMSIVSVTSLNSTGIVFARATKQCSLDRVKIVGWDVPYRMYGAWYAKMNQCSIESNVNGGRIGYETNDFTWFECDHTSNSNSHIEFESTGTCRRVQYVCGSLDGLPAQFGIYLKNVSSFSFRDTYFEIYDADSNTAPYLQAGQNVLNLTIDGLDLIFPTDNSYTGKAIQLGVSTGVGAVGVGLSNIRQYNGNAGTSIDATFAREVDFGANVRVSAPIVGEVGNGEIQPSTQSSILLPEVAGTTEITAAIGRTKRAGYSRIKFLANFTGTIDMTGRFLRIIREDIGTVVIDHPVGSVTAGVTVDLGTISGIPPGVTMRAYTYKVGSSITWPATTVMMLEI